MGLVMMEAGVGGFSKHYPSAVFLVKPAVLNIVSTMVLPSRLL